MDRFPSEFDDLLNRRGRRMLADSPQLEDLMAQRRTPIVVLKGVIDRGVAKECIRLLDRVIDPHLRRMHTPIAREALTGMKRNYTDELTKTVRVRTATLNSRQSQVLEAAKEIGLAQMMTSKSFLRAAQTLTRPTLKGGGGRQVICYGSGDYSGPHNDHHPEDDPAKYGFLDIHVMFSNDDVAQQLLVYEDRRHFLSEHYDISGEPAIAVYRLPFWHYTTPLIAKRGREATARRWLLLGSFDYDPRLPKLEY